MEPSSGFYWDPVLVLDFKGRGGPRTLLRLGYLGLKGNLKFDGKEEL